MTELEIIQEEFEADIFDEILEDIEAADEEVNALDEAKKMIEFGEIEPVVIKESDVEPEAEKKP